MAGNPYNPGNSDTFPSALDLSLITAENLTLQGLVHYISVDMAAM
jgi:hypothetical protein